MESKKAMLSADGNGTDINEWNTSMHQLFRALEQNQKLYGYEKEERLLKEACYNGSHYWNGEVGDESMRYREQQQQQRELVIISGPSGTGKTRLIETLCYRTMEENEGYFIRGKFDQNKRSEPYLPFVQAFTEFVELVKRRGLGEETIIQELIFHTIDVEDCLLLEQLIPALGSIFGRRSRNNSSKNGRSNVYDTGTSTLQVRATDAQERIQQLMAKLIQTIVCTERPLVLFIDDLQWGDSASLNLLQRILCQDGDFTGLCLIAAVRGNEVQTDDDLSITLRFLERDANVRIILIQSKNMELLHVEMMLYDILHLPSNANKELAQYLYKRADGNALFTRQLLRTMVQAGTLKFQTNTGKWGWIQDKSSLEQVSIPVDIVQYIAVEMKELPEHDQHILKIGACFGANFRKELVLPLCQNDEMEFNQIINRLCNEKQFLERHEIENNCSYCFMHDRIQQAAYSLIPAETQPAFSLELGEQLIQKLSHSQLEDNIFLVLSLVAKKPDLVTDIVKRNAMAALCLRAGKKAALASAFKVAAQYLDYGILFLPDNCWRTMYEESLALYVHAAEANYCAADFNRMDELINTILDKAYSFRDKLSAGTLRVYSLCSRRRYDEAFNEGLAILEQLGERFPSIDKSWSVKVDLLRTKRMIGRRTDNQLLTLPIITNMEKIAAMQILNIFSIDSVYQRPMLGALVASRMVQITLKYGQCATSAIGWMFYGNILNGRKQTTSGYRFSKLAVQVVENFCAKELVPRVISSLNCFHSPWQLPLRDAVKPLWESYKCGILTGDIEGALFAGHLFNIISMFAGRSLKNLELEAREVLRMTKLYKQDGVTFLKLPQVQAILNFRGVADLDPNVLNGEVMIEDSVVKIAEESGNMAVLTTLYYWKFWLACYYGEFAFAEEMAYRSRFVKKFLWGTFSRCIHTFFESLTLLILSHKTKDRKRIATARHLLKDLKEVEKQIPCNCSNKVLLIEAEFAVLKGNFALAMGKFNDSIAYARKERFVHEEALAMERAAIALMKDAQIRQAKEYLYEARATYLRWGADGKVAHMNKVYGLD